MTKTWRFYLAFLFSGLSGILYQILWVRILSLAFGGVTLTVALVASLFLAGLALGAFWAGSLVDWLAGRKSLKKLFLFYFLIELAIAGLAIFNWRVFLGFAYTAGQWRILIAGTLVFIHALVMGATWPSMFKLLLGEGERWNVGGKITFLNTFGGAIGAFLASFLLIANVGILGTLMVGLVGNLLAGTLVLSGLRRYPESFSYLENEAFKGSPGSSNSFSAVAILLILFLAGFAGMALEIFWMRTFGLLLGSSIYSFAIVLSIILLGLAFGGLIIGIWRSRITFSNLIWFVCLEAAFILIGIILLPKIPYWLSEWQTSKDFFFVKSQLAKFWLTSFVVFMPSFFSGLLLPTGVFLLRTQFEQAGRKASLAYFVNTLGSVFGGFLAAAFMLPLLGLQVGIPLMAGLLGIPALFYLLKNKQYLKSFVLVVLFAALGFWGFNNWDKKDLSSGVFLYGKQVLGEVSGIKLLSYKDGRDSTVSATWHKGVTTLRINGKADASNQSDMGTQVVLAHVPMLLHQQPKKVLVIGLGSGVTSGAISQHRRVEKIVTVEIEPAVVEVARKYFGEENLGILDNPKMELVVGDARNFLLETDQKFDVITAEPSNPWLAGEGNLFTKEYFELGKSKLEDNGVFFQWLHLYALRPSEVKSIIKTFSEVFPYVQLWMSPDPVDIFLAGKKEPFVVYWDRFQESVNYQAVKESLTRWDFDDEIRLFSLLWSGNRKTRELAEGGELNLDTRPILEHRAPYGLFENTLPLNFSLLLNAFQDDVELLPIEGIPALKQKDLDASRKTRYYMVEAHLKFREGDVNQAVALVETGMKIDDKSPSLKRFAAELYLKLGEALLKEGGEERVKIAIGYLEKAVKLQPDYLGAYSDLAPAYISTKEFDKALELLSTAQEKFPWSGEILMYQGVLAGISGDLGRAEELLIQAKELEPWIPAIRNNLAHLYYQQNRRELSIEEWEASLKLNPNQKEIRELLRTTENLKKLK